MEEPELQNRIDPDDPNPPPIIPDEPEDTKKEGTLFILKILAYAIGPSIIFLILLKLYTLLIGTNLKAVWEEATLIISGIMALPMLYFSKSISKVISKNFILRTAFSFVFSLVIWGYLYLTGKLYALIGIIDI